MQLNQLDSSNVTLVLKDGKEIKVCRNELSAASVYFSALLTAICVKAERESFDWNTSLRLL